MSEILNYIEELSKNARKKWGPQDTGTGYILACADIRQKIEKIEQQSAVSDCANFDALCRIREILKDRTISNYNQTEKIGHIVNARIEAETKAVKR